MHLALANSALPPGEHGRYLPQLAEWGLDGLEIVAEATWPELWPGPRAGAVAACGRSIRRAALAVAGLRLSARHPCRHDWLTDPQAGKEMQAQIVHCSAVCRDLGGSTLILGQPRFRHALPTAQAWHRARDFFERLLPRIEAHGTVLCLAPLPAHEGDFCNLAMDCRILADAVDHPALGLTLSARALADNREHGRHAVFASHYGRLETFLADEPGLAPFGSHPQVDHPALRRHLSAGGYRGWVCLDQRPDTAGLADAVGRFIACYRRQDNLSLARHYQQQHPSGASHA